MIQHKEIDEIEELRQQREAEDGPPPGWRPTQDTVQAIQGCGDAQLETRWVEQGIQDVPVSQIDTSDMTHVQGRDDFKKASYEDIAEGFQKLEAAVRPGVEKGAGGDEFYELDRQQGLDYADGYQRVYDAFYGGDAIRLEKDGEHYHVVNGAHRLYVAKQLGVRTVPARVVENRRG